MNKGPSEKIIILGAIAAIAAVVTCGYAILASGVLYFFKTSSGTTAQYFLTVDEVLRREAELVERNIRISGVVVGDSIEYDESALTLSFTIANVPADYETVEQLGGLEKVLHESANDPDNSTIKVIYVGLKPGPLQNESQPILTGRLGEDGIFYAQEILLRCPTRYEAAVPEQVQ